MSACWYYANDLLGRIGLEEDEGRITHFYFEGEEAYDNIPIEETATIHHAYTQICEYLDGKRISFTVPIYAAGTPFFQACWRELCRIPYGETRSYREIAIAAGNPKACRAVGMANQRNPIPIFIPCHRVIGQSGALIGYRGGLELKERLLNLEKSVLRHSLSSCC